MTRQGAGHLFEAPRAATRGVLLRGAARLEPSTVVAVAAVVAVVALGVFRDGAILPSERPPLVIALLSLGALWSVVGKSRSSGPAGVARLSVGGLAILALLALVSSLWSLAPWRSFWMALVYLGGVVVFFAGRRLHVSHARGLPVTIIVLTAAGALVSWISLVGYGLGWDAYVGTVGATAHALGPFGYANALASFVVLTLPASVWLAVCSGTGWLARAVAAGGVALELWALWLTYSRGAALGLASAALLVVWLVTLGAIASVGDASRRRLLVGGLGVSFVLIVLVAGVYVWRDLSPTASSDPVQRVAENGQSGQAEPASGRIMTADLYRVNTWIAGLRAARERPLYGWGMDTFYEAYGPFKAGAQTRFAHNVVVQHAVELGLLGLAAFFMASIAAVIMACRAVLKGSVRDPGVWLGMSVTAFLAHNLVDLTWYVPALFCFFWFCVGGVAAGDPHMLEPGQPSTGGGLDAAQGR